MTIHVTMPFECFHEMLTRIDETERAASPTSGTPEKQPEQGEKVKARGK